MTAITNEVLEQKEALTRGLKMRRSKRPLNINRPPLALV